MVFMSQTMSVRKSFSNNSRHQRNRKMDASAMERYSAKITYRKSNRTEKFQFH